MGSLTDDARAAQRQREHNREVAQRWTDKQLEKHRKNHPGELLKLEQLHKKWSKKSRTPVSWEDVLQHLHHLNRRGEIRNGILGIELPDKAE